MLDPALLDPPCVIRPGVDADGPGYLALIATCWSEYTPGLIDVAAEIPDIQSLATSYVAAGGAIWSAETSGLVVGMVATYPAEDGWHIARMYVAPGYRGTGLGYDLLRQAEDHARDAGATRMTLWSDVLFTRAHAFYEKNGYLRRPGLRALDNPAASIEARYAKPLSGLVTEELDLTAAESAERPLSKLLQDCVAGGACTPFHAPLDRPKAQAYWRNVTRAVTRGGTKLFAVWRQGVLAGSVQLGLDMPENGRHRAEVTCLLLAPGAHCRTLASALIGAAEQAARRSGRTLLTWAIRADEDTEWLYCDAGWRQAGTIPGHTVDARGHPHGTGFHYKILD